MCATPFRRGQASTQLARPRFVAAHTIARPVSPFAFSAPETTHRLLRSIPVGLWRWSVLVCHHPGPPVRRARCFLRIVDRQQCFWSSDRPDPGANQRRVIRSHPHSGLGQRRARWNGGAQRRSTANFLIPTHIIRGRGFDDRRGVGIHSRGRDAWRSPCSRHQRGTNAHHQHHARRLDHLAERRGSGLRPSCDLRWPASEGFPCAIDDRGRHRVGVVRSDRRHRSDRHRLVRKVLHRRRVDPCHQRFTAFAIHAAAGASHDLRARAQPLQHAEERPGAGRGADCRQTAANPSLTTLASVDVRPRQPDAATYRFDVRSSFASCDRFHWTLVMVSQVAPSAFSTFLQVTLGERTEGFVRARPLFS